MKNGQIKIFALLPEAKVEKERRDLTQVISSGRLPISPSNVEVISQEQGVSKSSFIAEKSSSADLVIVGFRGETLKRKGIEMFTSYGDTANVLFVSAADNKDLTALSREEEKEGAQKTELEKEPPSIEQASETRTENDYTPADATADAEGEEGRKSDKVPLKNAGL